MPHLPLDAQSPSAGGCRTIQGPHGRGWPSGWAGILLLSATLALSMVTVVARSQDAEAATSCDLGGKSSYLYCNPTPRGIFVMKHSNGVYYSYQVGAQNNFPVATSRDLINWSWVAADAKPHGATWWASDPSIWPMEVIQRNGKFYMFYSAYADESERPPPPNCANNRFIGLAIADSATGPFNDIGRPLMGGTTYKNKVGKPWGQIRTVDPNPFVDDDGQVYLYWSKPGGCYKYEDGERESRIFGAKLRADLKQIDSQPIELSRPTQAWERKTTAEKPNQYWNEAPQMLKRKGKYYLTYSANGFATSNYAVGYAVSGAPLGNFTK